MARMDSELYKACMFAKRLQKEGKSGGKANNIAGKYYGFSGSQVAYARIALGAQKKACNSYGEERQRQWDIYNENLALAEG